MKITRKGFTLVELLIVIAIIGVLGAMMTLSGADSTVAARAASIANGYKIIGSAYNLYKAISGDEATTYFFNQNKKLYLGPQTKDVDNFLVTSDDTEHPNYVFAVYDFNGNTKLVAKFATYKADMNIQVVSDDKPAGEFKMRIY